MTYEQQQPSLRTVITIKTISPNNFFPGFIVETMEGDRFQFGQTKKDGSPTVAYQQFTKLRPIAGDKFEIFYQEKESKPYLNKGTGKMVTSMNKTITKFIVDGEGNPTKATTPVAGETAVTGDFGKPQSTTESNLTEIYNAHANLRKEYDILNQDYIKLTGRIKALEAVVFEKEPLSESEQSMASALGIE